MLKYKLLTAAGWIFAGWYAIPLLFALALQSGVGLALPSVGLALALTLTLALTFVAPRGRRLGRVAALLSGATAVACAHSVSDVRQKRVWRQVSAPKVKLRAAASTRAGARAPRW